MKKFLLGLGGMFLLVATVVLMALLIKATNPQLLWYLARASGITSYLMLFLLTMTGLGLTSGFIFNLFGPVFSWRLHRTYGVSLIVFVLIHIVTIAYDTTMNFTLADIFIPFYSNYKPLYLSMGIIGFYLFVVIIITSLVWIVTKYKIWRSIHVIAFPAFILLFVHGILIGTDSSHPIMLFVYWSTGLLVAVAFFYRLRKAQLI